MAEIGRKGGSAPHEERGLQAADEQTRENVAREGGQAGHGGSSGSSSGSGRGRGDNNDNKLGFASMPKEKREEIARKGGEQ
jgi:general stress protein YciG